MHHDASQARLLIIPGLNDSPPNHWQSALQRQYPRSVRVVQRDWASPDVERWAARIGSTLQRENGARWLAVAHSFGALALLRHLALTPDSPVVAALLVAPANPAKFGIGSLLGSRHVPRPTTLVLSDNDPWLPLGVGRLLASQWGCRVTRLGAAGHVNVASGFHTLPCAEQWVLAQREQEATQAA